MPKNKKPMTLEDLARLVAGGFQDVDKRFREIAETMATKSDLEEFATRLDLHDVEERLTAELRKVHDLDRRFQTIEERLNQIEKRAH